MKINISFVIPVYNKSIKQVKDCVVSIQKIRNGINYEIIIIDDGSKADLSKIYKNFSRKSKIQYYYQENKGVSSARNEGIDRAKGKYIYFVDADDVLISSNFKLIKNNVTQFDLIIYDVRKLNTSLNKRENINLDIKENTPSVNSLKRNLLKDGILNWSVGKLYKRSFLIEHNIKFDINKKVGEDFDFVVKILNAKPEIYYLKIPTYIYIYSDQTGINRDITDPQRCVEDAEKLTNLRFKILSTINYENEKEKLKAENMIYNDKIKSVFEIYAYVVHFNIQEAKTMNLFFTNNLYKKYSNPLKLNFINSLKRALVKKRLYAAINMYIVLKQKAKKVYRYINKSN